MTSAQSAVWREHEDVAETPGLSLRTTFPKNDRGVEVMLEKWKAGTSEPPTATPAMT